MQNTSHSILLLRLYKFLTRQGRLDGKNLKIGRAQRHSRPGVAQTSSWQSLNAYDLPTMHSCCPKLKFSIYNAEGQAS